MEGVREMKKVAVIMAIAIVAALFTACGEKYECDFCGEEKSCQTRIVFGEKMYVCNDCVDELSE